VTCVARGGNINVLMPLSSRFGCASSSSGGAGGVRWAGLSCRPPLLTVALSLDVTAQLLVTVALTNPTPVAVVVVHTNVSVTVRSAASTVARVALLDDAVGVPVSLAAAGLRGRLPAASTSVTEYRVAGPAHAGALQCVATGVIVVRR
jgi:hypothetical protein